MVKIGSCFALYHVLTTPGLHIGDIRDVIAVFSEVFAVSQIYFMLAVKKLNLDVQTSYSGTANSRYVGTSTGRIGRIGRIDRIERFDPEYTATFLINRPSHRAVWEPVFW
ncbi:MAG: hypothetical protein ACXW1N_08260 [Halobacteriota archaeon]